MRTQQLALLIEIFQCFVQIDERLERITERFELVCVVTQSIFQCFVQIDERLARIAERFELVCVVQSSEQLLYKSKLTSFGHLSYFQSKLTKKCFFLVVPFAKSYEAPVRTQQLALLIVIFKRFVQAYERLEPITERFELVAIEDVLQDGKNESSVDARRTTEKATRTVLPDGSRSSGGRAPDPPGAPAPLEQRGPRGLGGHP